MDRTKQTFFQSYGSLVLLLFGIGLGSIFGIFASDYVHYLKPIGDIFLNLLFTAVIPLIFFAITSAVSTIAGDHRVGKIITYMGLVFLGTVVIAALSIISIFLLFPLQFSLPEGISEIALPEESLRTWEDSLVEFLTVGEFSQLLSRQHMLAFIIFSFILGIAALKSGPEGEHFRKFLISGNEVMKVLLTFIMKLAPIGLGAYFAYQVGTIGPQLFGVYAKPLAVYYLWGTVYFFVFFSLYAFLAYGKIGVKRFWKNNIIPSITAISTCSSFACIPANLKAAKGMGISEEIGNVVVPLGASLHKDGSSLSSIVKIVTAFSIIGRDFTDPITILTAIGITVLVSIVAGGIPSGGFIGELLMITVYGLPLEAVPAVMIIGALVDPLATVLNSTGDTVAAMLVNKFVGNKLIEPPTK